MNKPEEPDPRIYVTCLSSYSHGILFGEWIDAAQDTDDLHVEIALMLKQSSQEGAEEWAIHDHEGFAPLGIDEFESLDDVSAAAKLIEEHRAAAAHIMDYLGGPHTHEEARQALEESYRGSWNSVDDWVEENLDEGLYGDINPTIRPYIDAGRLGRDLQYGGDITVFEDRSKVHIFHAF